MRHPVKNIGRQLFALLSSLQLAVVTLLSLAIVLAVGTFYESSYDAATAGFFVYHTWWFYSLLGLLGINVLFAALSRYPWKRRHIGFLVVHLGILILLTGSFLTLLSGYEGQLMIPEGESADRIFLHDSHLFFFEPSSGALEEVPTKFRFDSPHPQEPFGRKLFGDVLLQVDDYIPNAESELQVTKGNGLGTPALQIRLHGSRATVEDWVFSRDYLKNRLPLGPATVTFLDVSRIQDINKIIQDPSLRGPVLVANGRWIPVKGNLGRPLHLKGKILTLQNYLPHAAVVQGRLTNLSSRPENPVVKLTVSEGSRIISHTVFAKYPELPTQYEGAPGKPISLKLLLIPEDLGQSPNEILLAMAGDGKGYYALRRRGVWQPLGSLEIGREIETGWMDFRLLLKNYFPDGEILTEYRKVSVPPGKNGPPPAVHLALSFQNHRKEFWLGRGDVRDVSLGPRVFKVAYALKSVPLGFELKLNKFKMGTYEGTKDPSSYESQVSLMDSGHKIREDHQIVMNHPLVYGRYKIFQASYQFNPDGSAVSVFSVTYDPGIRVKYLGSIILVLGIILIFFFRPVYSKNKAKKETVAVSRLGGELDTEVSGVFSVRQQEP